ncbi:MAG: MFS transporter [Candidatus Accumulibacter sp.]|nr:MFS transporter [Accumulibacter sp.]
MSTLVGTPTPPPTSGKARSFARYLAVGWSFILLISFALYDGLLYDSLRREISSQAVSMAAVSASVLNLKIAAGLRFGKQLNRFRGLDALTAQAMKDFPHAGGLAVLLPDGTVVSSRGEAPQLTSLAERGDFWFEEGADYLTVCTAIADRDGKSAGYTVIRLAAQQFSAQASALLRDVLSAQIVMLAVGLSLLLLLPVCFAKLAASGRHHRLSALYQSFRRPDHFPDQRRRNRLSALYMCLLLALMGCNTIYSLRVYMASYSLTARSVSLHIGTVLSEDLNKLMLVGVSLGNMSQPDQYLKKMSDSTPGQSVVLEVLAANGNRWASSHPPDTSLAENTSFHLPLSALKKPEDSQGNALSIPPAQDLFVRVSLTWETWLAGIRSLVLNVLTLAVISIMVMLESFSLFFNYAHSKQQVPELAQAAPERHSVLMRPLLFVFLLAMNLSVSFIPLRMKELMRGDESSTALLGLPISAEVFMAGCSILLAGLWIKRRGFVPPLSCGFGLAALGYLASMLAVSPWQFILARGLAGTGYGLALLTAQVPAVKEGKLAFLCAGVYAGMLCGSALGGILASSLGYSVVFGLAALPMIGLSALPVLLFGRRGQAAPVQQPPPRTPQAVGPAKAAPAGSNLRALLLNPAFLTFIFFSLIPGAFLTVGLLNFFLPLILHEAGSAQADIGRVFMLYCLLIIYVGPRIESLTARLRGKAPVVFWGGLAGAAAIGSFALLPPLTAALCGAVFLGLATCCNIPGQSGYLLRLKIAEKLGVEISMSILNTMERVGQVVSPLCVGALLAWAKVPSIAAWGGLLMFLVSLLFALSARLTRPRASKETPDAKR